MKPAIPPKVLEQHNAFLGKTGSGKTSTAKLAVEQILAANPNARVCVLDPIKSDWWGLTSSADGRRAGLPFYILGGPHGHAQLHPSSGKAIGELVASGALPLSIIDMADFPAGGLQEFFNDFAPALLRKMRGVVHLVIEEAHEFAPKERAGIGAESMAIYNAKKLATAGRSKGIRMMIVTQRTQALHNAVLGSCDTMFAHRLTAPADQEPVKKWLKANVDKETMERVSSSLSSLKTGSAWLCSGEAQVAELVQFPKIKTFDNSATPTGDMAEHSVKTAPVDLDKLKTIIGSAVKEAEDDNPKKLRADIAERDTYIAALKRQVAAGVAQQVVVDPNVAIEAEIRGFKAGFDEASEQGAGKFHAFRDYVTDNLARASSNFIADLNLHKIEFLLEQKYAKPIPRSVPPASTFRAGPPTRSDKPSPGAGGDGAHSTALINALSALAEFKSLGVDNPTREMVAAMSKYSNIQSRPIREAFSRGLDDGLMSSPSAGRVSITAAGIGVVGMPSAPPSTDEMRQRIAQAIGSAAGRVLEQLIKVYPRSMSREDLAAGLNYSNIQSRPIREAFSKLLDTGFVEAPEAGFLVATKALFP